MTTAPKPPAQPPPAPATPAPPETLKAFIAANASLMTIFTVFAGLAGFVLSVPIGWLGPVLRAGMLVMMVIVWVELLWQFPERLLLSNLRSYPSDLPWTFVWFAYLLQLLMLALLVFVLQRFPDALIAGLAAAVVAGVVSRLPSGVVGLIRVVLVVGAFLVVLALLTPGEGNALSRLLSGTN